MIKQFVLGFQPNLRLLPQHRIRTQQNQQRPQSARSHAGARSVDRPRLRPSPSLPHRPLRRRARRNRLHRTPSFPLNTEERLPENNVLRRKAEFLRSYSELTKTSTALPRLAVLSVLSAARRLVLI